ncbi:MAG: CBS domain-containing protein [Armatimonadetes bacterium]|nr:CBS domain-containing protein [Armatimonadota bacterium]
MKIKEIMTTPAITVSENAPLAEVVALLSSARISSIPIVNSADELVGIISEHDIIKAMMPTYEDLLSSEPAIVDIDVMETRAATIRDKPASSIMTRKVVTLKEDDDVLDAAAMILLKHIKNIPIVRGKQVVGIVARINVINAIMQGKI